MKKRILVLCLLLCMALIFTSCDLGKKKEEENEECKHTFSEAWSSDATNHWHRATCEHGEVKDGLAAHVDAGQDGLCDVCGYEIGHEHTYAETWSSDESKHWKAATCAHSDQKGSEGVHADDDKNYKCDVCEAHCHIVNPATGYCDGCNTKITEINTGDMATLLNAIVSNTNKVVSGTVDYDAIFRGADGNLSQSHDIEYSLYTDGLYTKRVEGAWANEIWAQLKGEDVTAISVEKTNGVITKAEPTTADVESLGGYYYAVSTLAKDCHGAEDILTALYALATPAEGSLNKVSNFTESINKDTRTAKFSYNILVINTDTAEGGAANYYEVKVEFGYSEANVLTSLTIVCDCYTNSLANEAENDYVYDQATKTITMKETATADTYTFVVAQTAGTRAAIDMTTPNAFIPNDLFIYEDAAHTTLATTVTVELGTNVDDIPVFYVGCPEGTFIYFLDDITVTVDKEGMTASPVGDTIQFYPGIAGTYVITLTSGSISKSVTVVVEGEEIQGSNTFDVTTTDTYSWDDSYTFTATESGVYTFYIPYGLGICEQSASVPVIDFQGNVSENPIVVVALAAGETYSFYFSAATRSTFTIGYSCTTPTTLVEGNNPIEAEDVTYLYTAPAAGTLTLANGRSTGGDVTVSYTVNGGQIFSIPSGREVTISLAEGDEVVIIVVADGYATLIATWEVSAGGGTVSETPLNTEKTTQINAADATFGYTAPSAGKLTLTTGASIMGEVTFSYTVNGGEAIAIPISTTVELTLGEGDKVVITVKAAGYSSLTAAWDGESAGGDDNEGGDDAASELVIGQNTITVTDADIEAQAIAYTLVVTNEGTYSFSSNDLMAQICDSTGMLISRNMAYLVPGNYIIKVVTAYVSAAGDYTLTLEYTAPSTEDEGDGSEGNPYVIESLPAEYSFNSDTVNKVYYLYTATANGVINITCSVENDSWFDLYPMINGLPDGQNSQSSNKQTTATFTVEAGKTYRIGLGTFLTAGDATFTLTFTEGEVGGGDDEGGDGEEVEISAYLGIGEETVVEVTTAHKTAGKLYASLYAGDAGEYKIESNDLYVVAVYDADGNVIERNDNWCYELEAYTMYTVELGTQYVSAGQYSVSVSYQYPEGHQENPIYFDWDYEFGTPVTATYKGDWQVVWYAFYATETGTVKVTTTNANATILLTAVFGSEAESVDGTVSLSVIQGRQYYIGVMDSSESTEPRDITFTPSYTEDAYVADGTKNAPNFIEIGENTASVPEYGCVWFAYKAEANGTLTVTTASDICAWYFDGQEEWATAGDKSIGVEQGAIVYLYVETSDCSAADIVFTASFEADPTGVYFGGVNTDGTANTITVDENTWVSFDFNGAGEFTITWDNSDAIVEVVAWGTPNTTVVNGGTIIGSNWGNNLIVYFPGYAAGTVNVTITPNTQQTGLTLGDNTVTVTDTWAGTTVTLAADEATTYVITPGTNAVVIYNYSDNYFAGQSFTITLGAGESVELIVATENRETGDVVVNVATKQASEGDAVSFVTGNYKYVDPNSWKHRWVLKFNADGTGSFAEQQFVGTTWTDVSGCTLTYTVAANAYQGENVTIDFADDTLATDGTYAMGTVSDTTGIVGVVVGGESIDFLRYE